MILVLSGTQDGREIALKLHEQGLEVLATAVSQYGGTLLTEQGLEVNVGALSKDDLANLISDRGITKIIDATHPYAQGVSKMTLQLCQEKGMPYYRYERPEVLIGDQNNNHKIDYKNLIIIKVKNISEAAKKAVELGKNIFLTIGSNHLEEFLSNLDTKDNITARVLPDPKVLEKCFKTGLKPENIIAMQGPFSKEMNLLMFKERKAQVIISKDSGKIGGTDNKLLAADELNLPVIILERPKIDYPRVYSDIDQLLNNVISLPRHL